MQIFIGRDGQQTGPFTLEQVQQMLAAGSATGEDLAWFEGAAVWPLPDWFSDTSKSP